MKAKVLVSAGGYRLVRRIGKKEVAEYILEDRQVDAVGTTSWRRIRVSTRNAKDSILMRAMIGFVESLTESDDDDPEDEFGPL